MELFILLIAIAIFAETSILLFKKYKTNLGGKRKIYVDTSVLIDRRILNIVRTGFLEGDLIILKSVLRELQLLADGKDKVKRNRARAGLDVVSEIERVEEVNTEIVNDGEEYKQVDEQLLKYARENKGAILTLDYNLIKVAKAEKISTLNINDLALSVRTEFLPGERIMLEITDKGANPGQGVGHLPDGTMVVVDKASNKVGQKVIVKFVKFLETSSGKMIFAKIVR